MAIPNQCKVLVIGGGPAGSYAAAVLARENVDTVLLEADVFPRYHIGESMLPSMRHFLRFIDLDEVFDQYGFKQKKGAMFKLNSKPEVYTDFVAAGGPKGYAWNVVRSEADDLMFRHAGKEGAKIFDGVKVESLDFRPIEGQNGPGRPTQATWSRKDGSKGTVTFDYVIDASGRAGVISTKYLKNRRFNQGLKNVASWGYWTGVAPYGVGTLAEGQPYFEALADASGWVWTIPLHNGVTSVGVVMNQQVATARKKEMDSPSGREFYLDSLKLTPGIMKLLEDAELTTNIKSASDWSYSASEYASPHARIAGDAGCFIDPFFSSGVHLAIASGLSAAVTICASMRGDVDEETAMKWHSDKVAEGYTRFLLVVLSALKQIRSQDEPVLSDWDEAGFERAFGLFRPIIQGTADVSGKLTQKELSETVDFCFKAFAPAPPDQKEEILRKVEALKLNAPKTAKPHEIVEELEVSLTPEEMRILKLIQARQMLRSEDMLNMESFSTDAVDGMTARLERGRLTLVSAVVKAQESVQPKADVLSLLTGEERLRGVRFENGIPKMPQVVVKDLSAAEVA